MWGRRVAAAVIILTAALTPSLSSASHTKVIEGVGTGTTSCPGHTVHFTGLALGGDVWTFAWESVTDGDGCFGAGAGEVTGVWAPASATPTVRDCVDPRAEDPPDVGTFCLAFVPDNTIGQPTTANVSFSLTLVAAVTGTATTARLV